MNKIDKIEYINNIIKYLNLSKVCQLYNSVNPNNKIDYNNLRTTLSGKTPKRLSEEKIDKFIAFLINHIVLKVFKYDDTKKNIINKDLKLQIHNIVNDIEIKILEAIDEEIQDK